MPDRHDRGKEERGSPGPSGSGGTRQKIGKTVARHQDFLDEPLIPSNNGTQIAKTWRSILEDDTNYFEEINSMIKDQTNNQNSKRNVQPVKLEDDGNVDYWLALNSSPSGASSIEPGGIKQPVNRERHISRDSGHQNRRKKTDGPNPIRSLIQSLLGEKKAKPDSHKAYKSLAKCTRNIQQYCRTMKAFYEHIELQIKFPTTAKIPNDVNVISAQLWLVTLALIRRIDIENISDQEIAHFRGKYHRILAFAVKMHDMANFLDLTLTDFDEEGLRIIGDLKRFLTGSSVTNLVRDARTSPDDDFLVSGDSWTKLTRQGMSQTSWAKNKLNDDLHSNSTVFEEEFQNVDLERYFGLPDTLTDRKHLCIYIRNVSKSGWMNFDTNFPLEQKLDLIRALLDQPLGKMSKVMSVFRRLKAKLDAGDGSCWIGTLMPWLRKMKKHIHDVRGNPEFCSGDYENLRFHLFVAELYLKTMIERGLQIKIHLEDIVRVSIVSATLLERKYRFFLPDFHNMSKMVVESKNTGRRLSLFARTLGEEDDEFFLNDYSQTLKEVPIYFRIAQMMLARKIELHQSHSAGDFNGMKFF